MMLAILHYEWVHYVAHIPYRPRTRLGRWIKQYHLRHHFVSEKHGSASAIPRSTACSARSADPAPAKKAPPPAISIREDKARGARRGPAAIKTGLPQAGRRICGRIERLAITLPLGNI